MESNAKINIVNTFKKGIATLHLITSYKAEHADKEKGCIMKFLFYIDKPEKPGSGFFWFFVVNTNDKYFPTKDQNVLLYNMICLE